MDPALIFTVLVVAAHTGALPVQNSSGINDHVERFKRAYLGENAFQNEMTAMDKIMEANELQTSPVMEGTNVREGDIAVTSRRGVKTCFARSCLWAKSVDGYVYVPYYISTEYDDMDRVAIQGGMEGIENGTCIRFVPRTHQRDFIDIQPKSGCWSYLGVQGGTQILSLEAPNCMSAGVTAHELMHALGFLHEQSRADRDKYVTILWANIWKDRVRNFGKYKTNNLDMPYDYSSIMHFGKFAYSEDGEPTIIPKKNPNARMGQIFGPSAMDKLKINKLYKC
ncbi:high choriolytic enzyme 1-like [Anguilla anguilla]|uniref:high choriolytic enzyme 1-like n=1 Tax=Anguilla anguilla TaxID=7936 RepID=UPI0015A8A641|nr:high choriolytic enzyme 1-like [Anguilla anguilla]